MIDLEEILRQFVNQVAANNSTKVQEGSQEIIFESNLDGIRYYIARRQSIANGGIHLSPREQAIATLIAQGLSNKCIGKRLYISPWTVATHIRRIFSKLGVNSRSEMTAKLMIVNANRDYPIASLYKSLSDLV